MTRCSVISWFVYSQCATRGYSLPPLATQSVPGLLLCSSATLVLWPWLLPSLNSNFLCFSSHMRSCSVDISLGCPVRPGGALLWARAAQVSLSSARFWPRHVTTHQSCGTKNIASNNIGSQSAQLRAETGGWPGSGGKVQMWGELRDSRYRPAPGPRSSALAAWSQVTCLLSVSRPDDKLSLD